MSKIDPFNTAISFFWVLKFRSTHSFSIFLLFRPMCYLCSIFPFAFISVSSSFTNRLPSDRYKLEFIHLPNEKWACSRQEHQLRLRAASSERFYSWGCWSRWTAAYRRFCFYPWSCVSDFSDAKWLDAGGGTARPSDNRWPEKTLGTR